MPNVTAVEPKGDKAAILVLDDGTRVWTPEKVKADPLLGKPIPSDWTMKEGDYGPQAFPPRDKKSGAMAAAFRNTKEGQAYEQERMDRRTALMQAVALADRDDAGSQLHQRLLSAADQMYEWLRQTAGDAGKASPVSAPAPTPRIVTASGGESGNQAGSDARAGDDVGSGGAVSGEVGPAAAHTHEFRPSPNPRMAEKGWEVCACGETQRP